LNKPYNPLEKGNLAESIVRRILDSDVNPLNETAHLVGAGVYVIYYSGRLDCYAPDAAKNAGAAFNQPIYIGKAIPKGGRKGGLKDDAAAKGTSLRDRLGQHLTSVSEGEGLKVKDFHYRCLVVDDIWIPLGENMLIERFKPVWNLVIDGFGNKDPGRRRADQYRSPWDVMHPGRSFTQKLGVNPTPVEAFIQSLQTFYALGKVVKPKKPPMAKGKPQTDDESEEEGEI
jgi:hypothetical protein